MVANKALKNQYIRDTLKEFTNPVTGTQRPYLFVKAPNTGPYHLLPNLFYFDPINQLGVELKCHQNDIRHENAKIVSTNNWTDYGKQPPRLIYGSTRNCYLVSRIYKCKVCNKFIIPTTSHYLSQLPQHPSLDIIIYHDSAVEVEVYNRIVIDICNGVTFAGSAKGKNLSIRGLLLSCCIRGHL